VIPAFVLVLTFVVNGQSVKYEAPMPDEAACTAVLKLQRTTRNDAPDAPFNASCEEKDPPSTQRIVTVTG
jgi:hypothetical protein